MDGYYGAKCYRCACLLGPTHDKDEIAWLELRPGECADCGFCQERALARAIQEAGIDIFSPETRAAAKAFMEGKDHPLINQLREEMQAEDIDELWPGQG